MKFLLIQTAFPGDVILATPVIEKLHTFFPDSSIDFLLRKGNEGLLLEHPFIRNVMVFDKKKNKLREVLRIAQKIRGEKYDKVVNFHRFASSGMITLFSGGKETIGFDKNPLSFFYSRTINHRIGSDPLHETERNISLIEHFTDNRKANPRLYPTQKDFENVEQYKNKSYSCIAPASVWFTKQFPKEKWNELIERIPENCLIYLIGAPNDYPLCEAIKSSARRSGVINLAGKLSFLESAALMKDAKMNYTNDSAPLHLASAMNAPVTAVFCSTIPAFGFGPLSDHSSVIEISEKLSCRPCGIHGYKKCPEKHFKCAMGIEIKQFSLPD